MKRIHPPRFLAVLLVLSLLAALSAPMAAASPALGDDLTMTDTLLNQQTQLSTNVFWSTAYSDYRTENLITYSPNASVTPIVTYGGVLTDRSTVPNTAAYLESQGYRVVAGINADFYNVGNGLPIGVVITEGQLRSSDGGYHAIGFRSDGTAILGRPGIAASLRYTVQDGTGLQQFTEEGEPLFDELGAPIMDGTGQLVDKTMRLAAVNKARTDAGVYLYTYDFNASHTTGSTQPGVDVICTIEPGEGTALSLGSTTRLTVERVAETEKTATALGPAQAVLSANAKAGEETLNALRSIPAGTVLELSLTPAAPAWNDVRYAVGALYSLVENGREVSGLPSGAAPRTAVGQRADGSLVFYTIDGRKAGHSVGASMSQVAQRLIELGCVTGLGLDGGGSTTLAVTQPTATSAKVVNVPSDGGARAVSNQIFLVASAQPTGELSHFHVSADHAYVLAGSAVNISAAAVDTNFIPMDRSYDLSASAGVLEGNTLTTPPEGGDVTVTARSGGQQGETVVHAVVTPDAVAVRDASNTIITELSAIPGSETQLIGSAAYKHLPLKADPAAFTWSVEGEIGSVSETGLFTASSAGEGTITVSAGGQSASIPVTVGTPVPTVLEDFEGETTIFRGSGERCDFSLNRDAAFVHTGGGSGKLDYDLTEGSAQWKATAQPAVIAAPYTALSLWVYGDGSGNTLQLQYRYGEEETQTVPITSLDFTGWKQIHMNLPEPIQGMPLTLRGLSVDGGKAGPGTVYLDQMVLIPEGAGTTVVESFEGMESLFYTQGVGLTGRRNASSDFVRMGRASLRLDYSLTAENSHQGEIRWNSLPVPANTTLHLWVYGDGSGNVLHAWGNNGTKGHLPLMNVKLDFTGWKQVSIPMGDCYELQGLYISPERDASGQPLSSPRTGTVYLDHITATAGAEADNAPPVIDAQLYPESQTVSGAVKDAVDGLLPAASVTVTYNGTEMPGCYDAAAGTFSLSLPGEQTSIARVTVTARDASGNIGRASVDIPAAGGGQPFTDTADYWGADYCAFLYDNHITAGFEDGTFRPDEKLTRLQFAEMLYNALRLDPAAYADVSLTFADLASIPESALPAVRALYQLGIVAGTVGKDGQLYFNPQNGLTRAQASAMIGRALEKGYAAPELSFTDAASIPNYAGFYIRTMVSQGILSGYADGTFRPNNPITRGQMAKILYTMM